MPENITRLQLRNYCRDPKVITPPRHTRYFSEVARLHDCCDKMFGKPRFFDAHFGLDGDPDACGPDDHHCRREAEYHVLLSNDTFYTASDARLAAIRAEEMPLLLPTLSPEFEYPVVQRPLSRPSMARGRNFMHSLRVDNRTTSALIGDLDAFERYAFRVYACTKITQCGAFYQHFERTLRWEDADHLQLQVLSDALMPFEMLLKVVKPERPNGGVVVSFEVEQYRSERLVRQWCLTGVEMERMSYQ